jgi:acid phosphatase type 7
MRSVVQLAVCMALAILLACAGLTLTAAPGAGQTATVTLVGAGDIASCNYTRDSATARLLGKTTGTVFTLGDNVYPDGTLKQFRNCYRPTWGAYKARTKPSVGNHEYHTPNASGYFDYFGARAGAPSRGYYSYDRGSWHIVVLNSNCNEVGGCARLSPQGQWLKNDLANHPARCTLAYFHHPLFASTGAATPEVRPFWKILYAHNADVILGGHVHYYERFAPQEPHGARDGSRGIREFVVGTGGAAPLQPMSSPREANSMVDSEQSPGTTAYGVLKLRLSAGGYAWKFLPVAGQTFTDSGTDQCH